MIISSVRLGHANNSSSTHSILLDSKSSARPSEQGDFQYGWDWFHIKDSAGKAKYLSALIFTVLWQDMSPEHAAIVAADLTGFNPMTDRIDSEDLEDPYPVHVDHQSVFSFPLEFGKDHYSAQFMREFVEHIRDNPRVSIRGGTDNSEENDNWVEGKVHPVEALPKDYSKIKLYCRKDGDWWVLYNRGSGAKIRLSFADNPTPYVKASLPELVDVKITSRCQRGCPFCYQGSKKDGRHAGREMVSTIARACMGAKVFEVALGGGEPTEHPEFDKILQDFGIWGVTTNFSTFDTEWFDNKNIREAVEKYAGSFAVSSPQNLRRLVDWNFKHQKGPQATFQVPLGCYEPGVLKRALNTASADSIPVTFLGFKKHGRGQDFVVKDYAWVLNYIAKSERWKRFGADSVFIEEFGPALKERGISEKLMVNREGAFSCYIDAVEWKMGASSYADRLHPIEENIFRQFPYVS